MEELRYAFATPATADGAHNEASYPSASHGCVAGCDADVAEAIASFAALIAAAASAGADGAACCDVVSAAAALDGGLDPALEGAFSSLAFARSAA